MIQTITAGIFLSIQTFWDIKTKKLPFAVTFIGSIIGLFLICMEKEILSFSILSFLPGLICFVFAKISKEAIGYGDAYLLGMLGFYCSISEILIICQIAFMLAAIVALVLLVILRKKKQYEMPFVPFLLLGFLIEEVWV